MNFVNPLIALNPIAPHHFIAILYASVGAGDSLRLQYFCHVPQQMDVRSILGWAARAAQRWIWCRAHNDIADDGFDGFDDDCEYFAFRRRLPQC